MHREARIVMPYDSKLTSATDHGAHGKMRAALLEAFGGYTLTRGSGGRLDDGKVHQDDVGVYDVAIPSERDASWDKLFQIAMTTGRALDQQAVYIRYPDGSVEIASVAAYAENGIRRDRTPAVLDSHASAVADAPVYTYAKRLPTVGEVWEAYCGALVAVLSRASVLDGGFNTIMLTKGESAATPGRTLLHDLAGKMYGGSKGEPRPMDLKLFVKRFTRD